MAKTKTTTKSSLKSWQDVDEQLRTIAIHKTAIDKSEAEMNRKVLEIQKQHEEQTREARAQVVASEKEIEMYCREHRDEFEKTKTKELNYGIVSFRLGNPELRTLKGFTESAVIKLLRKFGMDRYIRIKESLDKPLIRTELTEQKDLAEIGLVCTQAEQFYYEVKQVEII